MRRNHLRNTSIMGLFPYAPLALFYNPAVVIWWENSWISMFFITWRVITSAWLLMRRSWSLKYSCIDSDSLNYDKAGGESQLNKRKRFCIGKSYYDSHILFLSQCLMTPFTAGCQQTPFKSINFSLPVLRALWMFLSGLLAVALTNISVLQSLMCSLFWSTNYHNRQVENCKWRPPRVL